MPTNLVASATKLLTPELLSRLAAGLGLDTPSIQKAVAAGVPGLLAAFTSLVTRPGGAAKLADAVSQQRPDILTNVANASGWSGQKDIIDGGLSTLSSLLGGNSVASLAGALGRYAGVGEGGSKSVMGLLAPVLMGVLGQQQRAEGLDASGLTQLLQSQKNNIARALPSGFASQLADTGVLGPIADTTATARTRAEADYGGSQWNWALPVIALAALGALAWYLFGREPDRTVAELPRATIEDRTLAPNARDFVVTAEEQTRWMGRPVYSEDNQKVGEIIEIKRGPGDKVTDIVFDTGTFLGVGATRYHVSADQIREVRPDGLVLTLSEADIKAMPQAAEKAPQ